MTIIAYTILRVALGLNIFLHGIVRIKSGTNTFKNALAEEYKNSMLPVVLVKKFAAVLPATEAMIGFLLFIGFITEPAIIAGSFIMLLLLIGKSVKSDWMVVSLQMIYIAFYSTLEIFLNYNHLSIDFFLTINRQTCLY